MIRTMSFGPNNSRRRLAPSGALDTVRLAEALQSLVEAENSRLNLRRAEGRRELEARFGPRPVRGLLGSSSLRLSRLTLVLPCYAPKPGPGREGQAPERVRLERPGFWRRLFQRWQPLVLLFEISDDGSETLARASLHKQVDGDREPRPDKKSQPDRSSAEPGLTGDQDESRIEIRSSPEASLQAGADQSITNLPGSPEEQESS